MPIPVEAWATPFKMLHYVRFPNHLVVIVFINFHLNYVHSGRGWPGPLSSRYRRFPPPPE